MQDTTSKLPDAIVKKLNLIPTDRSIETSFMEGCIFYDFNIEGFDSVWVTNYDLRMRGIYTVSKLPEGEWLFCVKYKNNKKRTVIRYLIMSLDFMDELSKDELINEIKSLCYH